VRGVVKLGGASGYIFGTGGATRTLIGVGVNSQ